MGNLKHGLSRRERQIIEALYRLKEAGVEEVMRSIERAPGYSAVRTTLNILVQKGVLSFRKQGRRYLYSPLIPHERARKTALKGLLHTYFDGSVSAAVASLLSGSRGLTEQEYRELSSLIEGARRKK